MTTAQIFACAVAWSAVIVAVTAYVTARVTRHRAATRWHIRYPVDPFDGHGWLETQKPLTEEEYEALKVAWRREYGNNRTAYHVKELRPVDPVACSAFRPSTDPADSGLCARCGMFDYKHRESS